MAAVELPPPNDAAAPRGTDGRTEGIAPLVPTSQTTHWLHCTASSHKYGHRFGGELLDRRRIQMALLLPSFTMLVRSVGVRVALEDVYLFGLDTGGIESVCSSLFLRGCPPRGGHKIENARRTWAKGSLKREFHISSKTSHEGDIAQARDVIELLNVFAA